MVPRPVGSHGDEQTAAPLEDVVGAALFPLVLLTTMTYVVMPVVTRLLRRRL
ncbi:hypothetical protein [Amycolatopsis solani]|uniref:hypothetical protein n=1 Tax=Amycolatopsis solani TaxID=3028615 RepID=UPI0025AFF681|nr:hypothetical protein [Amycolatopsis sp. MEP2-6]